MYCISENRYGEHFNYIFQDHLDWFQAYVNTWHKGTYPNECVSQV